MRKITILTSFFFVCLVSNFLFAQTTVINTSFDDYAAGNLAGQNSWSMDEGGIAEVVTEAAYIHSGTQGIKFGSATTSSVELNHVAYDDETTGLSGVVYVDFWMKIISAPAEEEFKIAVYDLLPKGSRRACEFLFKSDGRFLVNGSSASDDLSSSYTLTDWFRLSAKIDYSSSTFEAAVDGSIISYENDDDEMTTTFGFREDYSAVDKGRATEVKEYHSLRFAYGDDVSDIAIDDIYVGTTAISDIAFSAAATSHTITLTQPDKGTITLDPQQDAYDDGDTVYATISNIPENYVFDSWTGSFAGTDNPLEIIVSTNVTLGADVIVDASNPPTAYTLTLNQTTGGALTVSPAEGPYYEGTSLTFTASPEIGYSFDSWNGISATTNPVTVAITENLTVSAVFTEGSYEGRTVNVSTTSELETALEEMLPGDEIILADGTYDDVSVSLKTLGGSSTAPVMVRAANQGEAKLTGSVQFSMTNCAYITFSGLDFDVEVYTLFKLYGCNNIRITRNVFKNTGDDGSKLIIIGDEWDNTTCVSNSNRVDHNLFDTKTDGGAWLVIDGSHGGTPQVSQYDRIDHNHFRFNGPRATNEKETIRIGMSDLSLSSAYCTVENNLFEECDGDPEVISVKSCDNYIRNNTFLKCCGTLSLRHGDRTEVSGNFFLGQGKTAQYTNDDLEVSTIGCGGVRVYGKDHKIFNNYFEGLTGDVWDAACTLTLGDASNSNVTNSSDLTKHYVVENLEFIHNTLVNNVSDIEIGYSNNGNYTKDPVHCLIANNIIVQDSSAISTVHTSGAEADITFSDNIFYTSGTGTYGDISFTATQATNVDPQLTLSNKRAPGSSSAATVPTAIYKLASTSPAMDYDVTSVADYNTFDAEGQAMVGLRDLGADEYNSTDAITNGVLDATHVGPDAVEFSESIVSTSVTLSTDDSRLVAYPNPFTNTTTIAYPGTAHLHIFNMAGQLVQRAAMTDTYQWTPTEKGIFVVELSSDGGEKCHLKLVVQ